MKKKIPVGILGATGTVGQKFVELLEGHPWFEITALAASQKSEGQLYKDGVKWMMTTLLSPSIAHQKLQACKPGLPCQIVFSALDADVAGEIEHDFAKAGYIVISNARNHRMDKSVPLLIPEVNPTHLQLVKNQPCYPGMIVTNPNCSVVGLTLALKPLLDQYGIEKAHVVTLQALSGAGYPGVPSFDLLDNVIPYISGEEEKVETEPLKILGEFKKGEIEPYPMQISAQCNRVAVVDGHLACVSVKFKKVPSKEQVISAWEDFKGLSKTLPTSPKQVISYFKEERYPQPKFHRLLGKGMTVSLGRLRNCSLFDWKFVVLSHNTIRGAAGCALLNAELMVEQGMIRA